MIEQQIISKILLDKSFEIARKYNISVEDFQACKREYEAIERHYNTYRVVPDKITFLSKFPDFAYTETTESEEYLAYQLKENKCYIDLVPVLENLQGMVKTDSIKAIEYLQENIKEIKSENQVNIGMGTDIALQGKERLERYLKTREMTGLVGINTGLNLLDEYTNGWQEEDLVTIVARTNEGKSWILAYFLANAWLQGKKVLLYSGEMSEMMVGYRVDTLVNNFSNMGLMRGRDLGNNMIEDVGDKDLEDYKLHLEIMKEKGNFIVVTPTDLGSQATVDDIADLVEYHKPDIVGIDQITLMKDQRRGENKTIQYTNISADLFNLSSNYKIPVLSVTQANREVAKRNQGKEDPEPPELHEVADSDGIAQNSTRILSLARVDNILKIAIKKNRYGLNNKEVLCMWNIDHGIIKPLLDLDNPETLETDYAF